jgi:hypothetical protein
MMTTYWIVAHVDKNYIIDASSEEEAKEMIYNGSAMSRGEEIVGITITYKGDTND